MPLQEREIARTVDGRLELRPEGVRVRWELGDLPTSDGHLARGVFTCVVKPVDTEADRRMLVESLMSGRNATGDVGGGAARNSVDADHLAAHFQPAIKSAAERFAASATLEVLLDPATRTELTGRLVEAAKGVAFVSGVDLQPPYQLDLESPTLRRQQFEAIQRQTAERRTAEQLEALQRSATLFQQFQQMRQASPDVTAGQLLRRVSPADQGEMLRALLQGSAKQSGGAALWAASGTALVRIDARGDRPVTEYIELPPILGPFRSITPWQIDGRRVLLIGAQRGVFIFDPQKRGEPRPYLHDKLTSPLGFNRAIIRQGELWATHSEAGPVCWRMDQPKVPAVLLRPDDPTPTASPEAGDRVSSGPPPLPAIAAATAPGKSHAGEPIVGPRHLHLMADGRLVFANGGSLVSIEGNALIPVAGEPAGAIVALLPTDNDLTVVHDTGRVRRHDGTTLVVTADDRPAGRLSAAALLPWLGSSRLLLATEEGPVFCVGGDDGLVSNFQSVHRGLRMLAGTDDLVAAVSTDRQRVIFWASWDGRKPVAEIHVYGMTKHRIADVAFG
jgi:hypothetical protein